MKFIPRWFPVALGWAAVVASPTLSAVTREAHASSASALSTDRIVVARSATIAGKGVRLGDVAELQGDAARFADIDLGVAPQPGRSRQIDGVAVLRRLGEAGMDASQVRYQIPASVRIDRAFQEIGADEIRSAIDRDAVTLLGAGESIRSTEPISPVRVALGSYELQTTASAATPRGTRRRFEVEVIQDGVATERIPVAVEVATYGPVVTTRRPLARGARITADDVMVEERDLTRMPAGLLTFVAQAIDKETLASLPTGAPLLLSSLRSRVLVQRGDAVTMIVESPGLRLAAAGEALDAGAEGARVRVRNRQSKEELSGQVRADGTILVNP